MAKIFSVVNKKTGDEQIFKADTKGQVAKYLAASFSIKPIDAVEVADKLGAGAKLIDATNVAAGEDDDDTAGGGSTGAANTGAPAGTPADSGAPASNNVDAGGAAAESEAPAGGQTSPALA